MENKNKIVLIVIILLTIIAIGLCIYFLKDNELEVSDASKFRAEYMELNDKINESLDLAYPNISISENNTVKYLSAQEAIQLLEDGSGIIYFGFSNCPWCRSLVPILTEVAEEKNETIYYLDISKIRSSFKLNDGKVTKTSDGSQEYYKILELLDENLEEFYLKDEEGNTFDTLEKRLYAPTLVAVSKGVVTDFHVGTVDSQESGYDKLNDSQKEELTYIIKNLINSKNDHEICNKDAC